MNFYRNKRLNMNKILAGFVMAAMATTAFAQSNTDSPYSQYGLGDLTDQSVGFNKGMNGVGIAMHKGNEVNPMNPASYSSVDSLSMIFDAGLSGQITNYKENGKHLNGKSGGFDYVAALFRVVKHVGVSFGVLPYSNIGYKYSSTTPLTELQTTVNSTYSGSGSIATSSQSVINTLSKQYSADISSYKIDLGIQYNQKIGKDDYLTIGATWSPGHSLKSDPQCLLVSKNASISKSDTTVFTISDGLKLPDTYGIGIGYSHAKSFRAGADFVMQKWGSIDFPHFDGSVYRLYPNLLKDSYRVKAGMEWTPRAMSRRLYERVSYRLGVGYATPYYYINGQEGPKEFGASIGFGIPIVNGYNNRSVLNISGQWISRSADNLIKENTFRINIGLTFNERWFAKWKVE